ncbi:type I secretion system permease/ATPase [Alsobacter sp. SYSU M60028]|uniref:Type I secretion system permease/ATPase n=1 Tax=Alsobacter ponti TaxID=2962936 RepID=A0ABT1LF94_9HYPH|nr:type I secretion system permease/ATPase [Alsobacter ponti]MCP8940114.1 type I secretion system permease/ATPase [Alsobacter ponti]
MRSFKGAFAGVGVISAFVNIMTLTGTVYMLEVYDRVLPSKSVPTLIALSLLIVVLFLMQGALEFIRGRILSNIGASLDETFGSRVYAAILRLPLVTKPGGDGLQPLRDLDQVRAFLGSAGPTALFDLPWMPLYLIIAFAFHFWIGMTALIGSALLIAITLTAERLTKGPARESTTLLATRNALTESTRRNAEVIRAMGMSRRLGARWIDTHLNHLDANLRASDIAGGLGSLSRTLRMLLQSLVLGVGAYLAIKQEVSPGAIIACSVLLSRSLQPVELSVAHWKPFLSARQSWARLNMLLTQLPEESEPMLLPEPRVGLRVENISVVPPGDRRLIVQDVSFAVGAGQGLGVIGPSASGKSSLIRAITGVWPVVRGSIRLDGAALDQWSAEQLGRHVGYLPQDIELFDGTVAENISRFDSEPNPEAVIEAATQAGVHDMILRLANGYETKLGDGAVALSAGQRQRVGLARALYGKPFLVVLDEPNSNLDAAGEEALANAMTGVRARGGIVIVVAHRPSALGAVDQVLVMNEGRMQAFGPKEEVFEKYVRRGPPVPAPAKLKAVGEGQG